MIQDQDRFDYNYMHRAEFEHRFEDMKRYFREREDELLSHIKNLQSHIDYHESILNNPEELLRKIPIADLEKYLRKIKLQNLKQNE